MSTQKTFSQWKEELEEWLTHNDSDELVPDLEDIGNFDLEVIFNDGLEPKVVGQALIEFCADENDNIPDVDEEFEDDEDEDEDDDSEEDDDFDDDFDDEDDMTIAESLDDGE